VWIIKTKPFCNKLQLFNIIPGDGTTALGGGTAIISGGGTPRAGGGTAAFRPFKLNLVTVSHLRFYCTMQLRVLQLHTWQLQQIA